VPRHMDGRCPPRKRPLLPEGSASTRLTRAAETLVLPAHAKLNLDLAVLGARSDGYHEISTRFQAISLHDLLLIEPALSTTHDGTSDDLVLRAQQSLEDAAGRRLPAHLRLVKRIPAGAGLGGGSADAAATLRGLSRLYGLHCDLKQVAAGLGADVPFFLVGGAATATGRGELLAPAPPGRGWYALAWPGFPLSTPAVYRKWDEVGGEGENELTRAAIAVEPRMAEFAGMLGAGWQMTGSGSAFFKLCLSQRDAEREVRALKCWAVAARPVGSWGEGG
jgi:4-diphosphocytidyl-2-C-methyl-D-erythritol kinase